MKSKQARRQVKAELPALWRDPVFYVRSPHLPSPQGGPGEAGRWLTLHHEVMRVLAPWCDHAIGRWLVGPPAFHAELRGSAAQRRAAVDALFAWAREHDAPIGLGDRYLGFECWIATERYLGREAALYFGNPDGVEVLRVPPDLFRAIRGALQSSGFPPDLYGVAKDQQDHFSALMAGRAE
jgi:hypothetical protein